MTVAHPPPAALRVLLADDSDTLRRLLRDAIDEVEGVEVVAEVPDGAAALVAIRNDAPEVVVLDVQMPVMGGLEALPAIVKRSPRPRVIMLTNHSDDVYREACLSAGADHFFDKSSEVDSLLDVLRVWASEVQA